MSTATFSFQLKNGNVLDVEATPEFVSRVAKHFGLSESAVTSYHVKIFFESALKNAVEKAEKDLT